MGELSGQFLREGRVRCHILRVSAQVVTPCQVVAQRQAFAWANVQMMIDIAGGVIKGFPVDDSEVSLVCVSLDCQALHGKRNILA
jgi:hypothetical protein